MPPSVSPAFPSRTLPSQHTGHRQRWNRPSRTSHTSRHSCLRQRRSPSRSEQSRLSAGGGTTLCGGAKWWRASARALGNAPSPAGGRATSTLTNWRGTRPICGASSSWTGTCRRREGRSGAEAAFTKTKLQATAALPRQPARRPGSPSDPAWPLPANLSMRDVAIMRELLDLARGAKGVVPIAAGIVARRGAEAGLVATAVNGVGTATSHAELNAMQVRACRRAKT